MKYFFSWSLFLGAISVVAAADESVTKPSGGLPNIVIILADDLGYGDPHCYNPERGKISTPNIDKLAAQGMRFTDAHSSAAVCSPSRYTLLTGRYHWRTRLQGGIVPYLGEPEIEPTRLTIAGLARQNGYATACIGKWHLGMGWDLGGKTPKEFVNDSSQLPKDEDVTPSKELVALWKEVFSKPISGGPLTAGFDRYFGTDVPNWPPFCFIENDRTLGIPKAYLHADQVKGEPFMASFQGPALEDWNLFEILPTIGRKACEYVREQAADGKPFLLYFSLTSPHEPLAVNEPWRGKSGLHYYADFVMETDAVVGSVLEAIQSNGIAENTLVIFTSDNGSTKGTRRQLEGLGHFPSGPLRGYKHDVWEGGHRIPFIVRWPGHVAPESVCDRLVHQADVMATLAEILDRPLPPEAGVDSFSFLPLLKGSQKPVRNYAVSCGSLVRGGRNSFGFRSDDWKLIVAEKAELYNLAKDMGETTDLATQEPERVKEMQAQFEQIILNGRSTLGPKQANDVAVQSAAGAKGRRSTEQKNRVECGVVPAIPQSISGNTNQNSALHHGASKKF